MNSKKIDLINIFLIIISLVIAIKIPFELFLFSYAVLGPLHYLTEITWLREKNYFFSANKNWSLIFLFLTILISLYPIIAFTNLEINQSLENVIKLASKQTKIYLVIGFLFAVSLIFLKRNKDLTIALLLITLISFTTISYIPRPFFLIGAFLPTLIHVYIFTFLFILFGALKAKSNYGYYLGILLLLVPLIICYIPFNYTNYKPSKGTLEHFNTMNMTGIINFIAKVFNNFQDKTFLTLSEIGLRIQIFISFAYTYHYLNWFSKTSIIGWKKAVSKKGAFIILLIWTASIGLYLYDFKTGLIALYLLSFLHVLLEFPLNVTTIKEVLVLTKMNNLKLKPIIRKNLEN